jgi:nicotinate phosphoribosyltransferase
LAEGNYADFGTRRRRSFRSQELVVETMKDAVGFMGTSNVYLAKKHNVKAIGTQSHQWIMGVSALRGLRHCNSFAMDEWVKTYNGSLGIVLTDTYGTEAFLKDFDLKNAKLFDGVRHDSGDPIWFADLIISHYKKLGIDPMSKIIIFSDGLDDDIADKIRNHCKGRIKSATCIGTFFSNDYKNSKGEKSKALSIVIKLYGCAGVPVVKLSDNPAKAAGDEDAVRVAEWTFYGQPLDYKASNFTSTTSSTPEPLAHEQ